MKLTSLPKTDPWWIRSRSTGRPDGFGLPIKMLWKSPARLILILFLALAGCAPAISTNLQQQAAPRLNFAALSAHPDRYKGKLVILGGLVMSVKPWKDGSLLTVDQRRLDSRLYPVGTTSGGSFAVESNKWLNSNWYLPKSKVVVAGVVEGQKEGMLLLKAKEVHLLAPPTWEKWNQPIPPSWYGNNPQLKYWFTPPYFSPWMGPAGRK
jgi:outer membrane lipoprotein